MADKLPSFNLIDSSLLEKIDRLFACNAGHEVDLPQLVVVGQQSSGKSSVLEGLTGLPFPRDSGLCTRFATQITFRRSKETKISASIIAANPDQQERMDDWGKRELDILNADSFAALMREVINVMGVGPSAMPGSPAFSEDVLVLEIAGPDQEHFSVIDVPGTFKKLTEGLTTKDDVELVFNMVKGYMKNSRSVMLTVVPCNADIANEDVVQLADDLDPDGHRTLGVLTKPDLVDEGAEDKILDVINGKTHRLKLGWHLVRNLGQKELMDSSNSRGTLEEKFFQTREPWNTIDKDKVGVLSLRVRLQSILADHIRREFPKVKKEIRKKLGDLKKMLELLGPKRQTPKEQDQFLTDLATQFQDLANSAARAQYVQSDFFGEDPRRCLATVAVNRGEVFSKTMEELGHEFEFAKDDEDDNDGDEEDSEDYGQEESDKSAFEYEQPGYDTPDTYSTRLVFEDDEITDVVEECIEVEDPRSGDIMDWITGIYRKSRGFELGSFDCSLLVVTMQRQAKKWRNLAKGYISDVIAIVHYFVLDVLKHVVPDLKVQDSLKKLLSEHLRAKYLEAMAQTEFLLKIELEGTPATYNRIFNEALNKCRTERLQRQLSSHTFLVENHGPVVRLDDIVNSRPLRNDQQVVQEIHDILKSYYELARKRFVDNVRMQAADYFLVTGPNTPLKLFSSRFVSLLTEQQLDDTVGEKGDIRRQRDKLEKKIRLLEESMAILR